MTTAVTRAVQERLERIREQATSTALAEELLAIGRDCAQRLKTSDRGIDHANLLYDDFGLPK